MTDEEYTAIREWILQVDRKEIDINEFLTRLHRFHFEGEKLAPFSAATLYRPGTE